MIVYDRIANKEKKVDMLLGVSILDVVLLKDPGTIILVAGEDDYSPVLTRVLDRNWKVETWFWFSGISGDLTKRSFVTTWMTFTNIFHMRTDRIQQEKIISLE